MTACRLELRMRTTFILVHGGLIASSQAFGFQSYRGVTRCHYPPPRLLLFALEDDNEELDDLTPPSVSFTRNSVLFGENPPTQRSNGPLWLWQGAKKVLPPFVTGAWEESKGDKIPVEHLYNLLFVRMPVVLVGILYVRNLILGHPLVMNYGDGFFEVPPLVVLGVFLLILR